MTEIGPPPEPINSAPVDLTKHWSILDQSKAEFLASGRCGIVIFVEPDDEYREKLSAFLEKFGTKRGSWNMAKPYLLIEHATEARALFNAVIKAGLRAELIEPKDG